MRDLCIPEPNSGCHLWLAGVGSSGYGVFSDTRESTIGAHQAAWIAHRGPIPEGAHVLHDCDTKLCVNPEHLKLGTHAQNMREAFARGLNKPIPKKLSAKAVAEIRASASRGRDLALRYGVTDGMIAMIRSGKRWGGAA